MKIEYRGETFEVKHRPKWWMNRLPTWETEVFDVIDELAHLNRTFIDVGAWMGPYTMYAARRFQHVWAFEPDDVAYSQLTDHVMMNKFLNMPFCVRQAAHTNEGFLPMHSPTNTLGASETNIHGNGRERLQTTMCFDLNAFLSAATDVRLLKMDVEGSEVTLLPHIAQQCRERGIVVVAEIHRHLRWPKNVNADPMLNLLREEGIQHRDANYHAVLFRHR